jgi:DNA-directed RNA polymerase specialized sigma24 family protein
MRVALFDMVAHLGDSYASIETKVTLSPDLVLSMFGPDPDQAEERYWLLRQKLIMYLARRGCTAPEDQADETVYRLLNRIEAGAQIESVEAFAFGIARNVSREPKDRPVPIPTPARDLAGPSRLCLKRCFAQLDAGTREMLEAFFLDGDRVALARRFGLSRNALGIRVCRAKARIRPCLERCLAEEGIALKRERRLAHYSTGTSNDDRLG